MRTNKVAAFCISLMLFAVFIHGKATASQKQDAQQPVHLAILDARNNTGDVSLEWFPKGVLELLSYSLSYMRGIKLVPVGNDITSGDFPVIADFAALDIHNGLSVSLEGTADKYTLVIKIINLRTGAELLKSSFSGTQAYILFRIPEAAAGITDSIGYAVEEDEIRRSKIPATTSPLALRHFTEAIYGPENYLTVKLEAALSADRAFAEALAKLAILHIEEGKKEKAVSEIVEALRIKPFLHTALYAMARHYDMKGDTGNTSKYISRILEINPRNRFLYDSLNIDSARGFYDREDYRFFGPEAALLDLESPAYYEGAFKFLSSYKSYSKHLGSSLNSPNIAIRLTSMKWHKMAGLRSTDDSMWHYMGSSNSIHRALALEMFSEAGNKNGCKQAIRSMTSTLGLLGDHASQSRTGALRYSLLLETARAVGARCDSSSKGEARKLLKSKDHKTRLIGACLLGLLGISDEMDGIPEAISRNDLFMLASDALVRVATEENIDQIYEIIQKVPSSNLPLAAIAAFDTEAASAAMANAITHTDKSIRISAAHALGHSHTTYSPGLLLRGLSDSSPEVRIAAALSIKKLDIASVATEELKEMLKRGGAESKAALIALSSSMDKAAVLAVVSAASDKGTPSEDRASAILGLNGLVPDDIKHLISNSDGAIRAASLRKSAEIGADGMREGLVKALSDTQAEVRIAALEIISKANSDLTSGARTGLSNVSVIDINISEKDVLSHTLFQDMDILKRALADDDPRVKVAAANALGTTMNKDAITALALSLNDKDSSVRIEAARSLGKIWSRESDLALKNIMDDPDPEVRTAVLISRVKLGGRSFIDTLAEDSAVSGNYVNALSSAAMALRDRALSVYLLGALTMPGPDMRPGIYSALVDIGAHDGIYRHLAATGDTKAFQAMRTDKNYIHGNLGILTEESDDYVQGAGYYLMALRARDSGDMPGMHRLAGKAYKYAKGSGREGFTVASLILKAEAELAIDKPKSATGTLKKALKLLKRTSIQERRELYGDLEIRSRVPMMLGHASSSEGNSDRAAAYYKDALSTANIENIISGSNYTEKSRVIPEALRSLRAIKAVN